MRELLGENPCVITAHPDDEVLWAGGLILANPDLDWTIVCCSIPRIDPIRAWKWNVACQRLGVVRTLLVPSQETEPDKNLSFLPRLTGNSSIVTHGMAGEYGHMHHRQLYWAYTERPEVPVITFNLGGGEFKVEADQDSKLAAIMAYDHKTTYEGREMPKWRALLQRYGLNEVEGFDHAPEKHQWHVLTDMAKEHGYRLGAELGVRWGQTSRYVLENTDCRMIGVDLMQVQPEKEETYEAWPWERYEAMVQDIEKTWPDRFDMRRMDTSAAAKTLEDGELDFVFIDADHSYEGVKTDIEMWTPKVRKGGMIVGHDIDRVGVKQAVVEAFGNAWATHEKRWNNCWWVEA